MKLKLINKLKQNVILILSILVILSPIMYINRTTISNIVIATQDKLFPLPPGNVSWLSTSDNKIINEANTQVVLRGVNIASNQWSVAYKRWHPSAVQEAAKNWQVKVIRTRVFENDFTNNPFTFFRDLEEEIIKPARAENLYVILHPWLGENNSLPTEHTKEMWESIAKRYSNDPTIIYDILAEPRGVSFEALKIAYNDLIPAIRAVNPKSLIMITGLDWGRDINRWENDPLPYPNLVYRTNPYNKRGELEGYFLHLVDKYPVFLGEYGTSDDLTAKRSDVDYLIKLANAYQLGWTAWNFSAAGCPCLLSNESTFEPSEYGSMVLSALTKEATSLMFPPKANTDKFFIYEDFLDNGFTDYSWDILRDLISTEKVYSGTKSILADYRSNGGLYLHSVRELSKDEYQNLLFFISTPKIKELGLKFRTSDDSLSPSIKISDYAKNLDNGWYKVTIPLELMPFTQFSSLMFEPVDNTAPLGKVFFDEITVE